MNKKTLLIVALFSFVAVIVAVGIYVYIGNTGSKTQQEEALIAKENIAKKTQQEEDVPEEKKKRQKVDVPDLSEVDITIEGKEWMNEDPKELELVNKKKGEAQQVTPNYYTRLTIYRNAPEEPFLIKSQGEVHDYYNSETERGYLIYYASDESGQLEKYQVIPANYSDLELEIGDYVTFEGLYMPRGDDDYDLVGIDAATIQKTTEKEGSKIDPIPNE